MPFITISSGNRHLLLDLLGGDARPLRDDLDVVVGHVGISFDRQLMERNSAPDKQQDREGDTRIGC
jgi:hypothetical protein